MAKNNWIIVTNFGLGDTYYTRILNDVYQEVYDPRVATVFTNKREAQQWIKKNSTMQDYMHVEKLEPHVENFLKFKEDGMVRREFPLASKCEVNIPYDENVHTWEDVVDWRYQYSSDREVDVKIQFENYQTWPQLYSISKHLWGVTAFWKPDYSDLLVTFELVFPKDDSDFTEFKKELKYVINNYDITYTDEDGNPMFTVFDNYLSEGGNVVYLVKKLDNRWSVRGRNRDILSDVKLKTAYEYLVKYRYYGDDDEDVDYDW